MDQKYSLIISPNFEDEQGFWPKISQESAYTNFKLKKEKPICVRKKIGKYQSFAIPK